jgi:RNA polymerase sigma-70 factor (ECF subfamily)
MDKADFHALYERYARDVYRFALYLSGHRAQAEDIAAETFSRAWTATDDIRTETVKAYLFAIARNLVRERHRESRRAADLTGEPRAPGPDPSARTETRMELEAVLRALQLLPESDRAALLMRAQDEMSHEEIAAALGLSVAAVRVKIHRARLKLCELKIGEERRA